MTENEKSQKDDLSHLLPKNANIGVVGIAVNGGVGIVGTPGSPIIGIASSGGPAPEITLHREGDDEINSEGS